MGCFDTIIAKSNINCPGCNTPFKEFQTKDLGSFLDEYREGNMKRKVHEYRATKSNERNEHGFPFMVQTKKYSYEWHPSIVHVTAYDFCKKCDTMIYQDFRFDSKGKLDRYGVVRRDR